MSPTIRTSNIVLSTKGGPQFRKAVITIESDVLVIGGRLARMASVVAAVREGATVRLTSHKKMTLRQASGLVGAPGYVPSRDSAVEGANYVTQGRADFRAAQSNRDMYQGSLVRPTDGFGNLPADHPYSLVGESALRDGLTLFNDFTGDAYHGGHTDRNALLSTSDGVVKPTARYPRAAAEGLVDDGRPILVVGSRSLVDSDTHMFTDSLGAADVPFPVTGIEIEFVEELRADVSVTRIAKALDHDEHLDGTPMRRVPADAVKPYVNRAERVSFPTVLGDDRADAVRVALSEQPGVDVSGIPVGSPNLPGLRLEDRLYDVLGAEGVLYGIGNPVVDYKTDSKSGHADAMLVDRKSREVPYVVGLFVLATGGLVDESLGSDRTAVRELVFDCRVPQLSDRYDWLVDGAFGVHSYARFGVEPSARMQPFTIDETPEFEDLFVTGVAVGDADAAQEKFAMGVPLATGAVAGRDAVRESGD